MSVDNLLAAMAVLVAFAAFVYNVSSNEKFRRKEALLKSGVPWFLTWLDSIVF